MIGNLCQTTTTAAFAQAQSALAATGWRDGQARANMQYVAGPAMSALSGAGVPRPGLWVWTQGVGMAAIFFPDRWKIRGNPHQYGQNRADVTDDMVRARAAQLYHEARHAEQYFLAARLITTRISTKGGQSLNKYEADLIGAIPATVRDAASRQPLTATDAEAAEIGGWIRDYSDLSSITAEFTLVRSELTKLAEQIEKDTPGVTVAYRSQDACDDAARMLAAHTRLAEVLRDSYQHTFTKYLRQSAEHDAYAVGSLVGCAEFTAQQAARTMYDQTVGSNLGLLKRRVESRIEAYRDTLDPTAPATAAPQTGATPPPPVG
jgi:hypothetical protein